METMSLLSIWLQRVKSISKKLQMNTFKKILQQTIIFPIRFYQWGISPFFPASCRHVPTCSTYAVEAIKIHGIFRGTWLALKRLSKCHPWGTHGYDPVPEGKSVANKK